MKKRAIMIFPHLNDCRGNENGKWYVEYEWLVPGEQKRRRERIYKGLNEGSAAQRYRKAKKIIEEKTEWLKSGQCFMGYAKRVYADELMYRNEAKLYGNVRERVVNSRSALNEFLAYVRPQVNDKTYSNYVGKMRIFNAWLENNELHELHVRLITRQHIIDFSMYLATVVNLSRASIDKYIQIIRGYFDWECDRKNIEQTPVYRIPKMGKHVDLSPMPYSADERTRLKVAISNKSPWLWLACEIQFYCAIRPGTEIRLMKIGWIDWDNKQIRIPSSEAKNNQTEIVDVPEVLMDSMKKMNLRMYDSDLYIFGKDGLPSVMPLGKNTMRNRFNKYREALGISKDRKFYSWKHTGAIALVNAGAQPLEMKEHLRHKQFDTTEKYLKKRIKLPGSRVSKYNVKL